jgi:acetyltransferase
MSIRHLDSLFHPKSVAVIGASNQPRSVGAVVMRNLLAAGFAGPVMPVNPKHQAVSGVLTYPDVANLPLAPDLAVICTPSATVPELVRQLGERGTRAAAVLSAGLGEASAEDGKRLQAEMLDAARPHLLRILGPNCLGLIVPGAGLNASFSHTSALPGKIAFLSQSGALCTAVLDWAEASNIGFSHFVSLGNGADVDFGDLLDYLGGDPATRAILLYIESITAARKFMSAARAAARNKPVIAIKAGRAREGAEAALSHTGALAGSDDVYDAALRRTGMLRVFETDALFDAVETLARFGRLRGDRLAVVTNGGGPGVLATDALVLSGGRLAKLSEATVGRLDALLPATWSRGNPIDIIGDADGARYAATLEALLDDPGADAILVMHAPTAISSGEDAARAVVQVAERSKRSLLTSWLGRASADRAREIFAAAGIATYDTPDKAVRAFVQLVEYRRNQDALMETPPSAPIDFSPDVGAARRVIEAALAEGRDLLSEPEAKAILAAYGVPAVETRIATSPADAARIAAEFGFPVALKILATEITHKSDVGGVQLDLATPNDVQNAAKAMRDRVAELAPGAEIQGFTVQHMARRPNAHELIVGAMTDPTFGPVLLFGQGGIGVEAIGDRALGLPPLNMSLAREMVSRTRVARLLEGYRDRPAADLQAICLTLVQVSQMIVDLPEIVELDINPLFADESGVLALDARMRITPASGSGADRLAIRPYPRELEEWVELRSGQRVLLRPIRPEDEPAHQAFHASLAPEDIRYRFFGLIRALPHSEMARFTQIDYDREMAFIATASNRKGEPETLGVVRTVSDPDNIRAEYAIIVRSDMKRHKLGQLLLEKMIRYCRSRGTTEIVGQVLPDNRAMLGLVHRLGFKSRLLPDADAVEVKLVLRQATGDEAPRT